MFDSDILGNRQVFNTISEMARMLMEKVPDLKIKFAIWKIGYGKGIDDCILAGNIREVRYIDAISFMNTCNEAFDMLLKKYEVKSFKKMKSEDRKIFGKYLQEENEKRLLCKNKKEANTFRQRMREGFLAKRQEINQKKPHRNRNRLLL